MKERVKELRQALGLTMEKFGERLGVTRSAMSNIENGNRNLTEQMFKSICREFHVNEDWLRNGNGDMFVDTESISLDDFISANKIDDLESEIVKAYFSLDKDIRKKAIEHLKSYLQN